MKKTVLVTGSSTGIGQATAYEFAKAGWNVIVTHLNNKKAGAETLENCIKLGAASAILVPLDITSDKSIKSALTIVKKKFKKIDVLVNNAGVLVWHTLSKQSTKDIERQVRTNLEGTIRMTLLSLSMVKEAIVNVASQVGEMGYAEAPVYAATKWGVRGFTKSIAFGYPNLKVFSINPGGTATPMTNFRGIHPSKVGNLILSAVEGKYKVSSGGDIDVWKIYPS